MMSYSPQYHQLYGKIEAISEKEWSSGTEEKPFGAIFARASQAQAKRCRNIVHTGDLIFLKQDSPVHYLSAGYEYYTAAKLGDEAAKARLDAVVNLPETLHYFNENDLAYNKGSYVFELMGPDTSPIKEYRQYIASHYASELARSAQHSLFYKTNTSMFVHRILNDISDYHEDRIIRFGNNIISQLPKMKEVCAEDIPQDPFLRAKSCHKLWWYGHSEYRDEFIKLYRLPEVIAAVADAREKMKQSNPDVHYNWSPDFSVFFEIIEKGNTETE